MGVGESGRMFARLSGRVVGWLVGRPVAPASGQGRVGRRAGGGGGERADWCKTVWLGVGWGRLRVAWGETD